MRIARWTLLVAVLIVLAMPAAAQDYSFSVPRMVLELTPNPDASVTLDYTIQFHCNQGAHPIDVVDMGLPHDDYDISNMSASVDGTPLSGIKPSTYIDTGVEVPISPAVQPGETGTFRFQATMPDMVYQDTTDSKLAILQITPTYWGSAFVTDTTDLLIAVYLPDSVDLQRVKYRLKKFTQKAELESKKAVMWRFPATTMTGEHMVDVSFPKDWMDRVIKQTVWDLAWKWWTESSGARTIVGILMLVAFSIWYFRLTAGTGTCLFIPLVIAIPVTWTLPDGVGPAIELVGIPVLILLFIFGERLLESSKRSYLPPIESVPGGQIKRGLTAPEAAVLLVRALGDVLTLLIFGMLQKGLVAMTRDDPLTVEVAEPYRTTRGERRKIAAKSGSVIRGYEQPFLDAIMEKPGTPIPDLDLSKEVKALVDGVVERMEGFDLERTKEYYESIVYKAWKEARTIGDVEKRDDFVDQNIGWLMLDTDRRRHFHTWHTGGYHYSPRWAGPALGGRSDSGPAVGGRTTAGDVAASFAGWSENVAGNMASTMDPVSVGITDGGVMDLSGVDKVGMDFLESMAESSGSGGGYSGGGGCACACAGCACACACAGGGR